MANAIQSINSGGFELKNVYQGPIVDLINEELKIYRACEKLKEGWSGLQVVRPLRTRRNQGIGATSDGGLLPKIGRQSGTQATIQSAFNYLRFGVTGPMIAASQSDTGSFVRSAGYELEMGYNDFKADISRQLSWNGRGDLALIGAAASATTTLTISGRTSLEPALKFVDRDLTFDVIDVNSNIIATGLTVVSISSGSPSSASATIVLDQPVTASVGNILIRTGSNGLEMKGIYYALDGGTSTIYSVDRSQNLSYQGNVTDVSANINPILSIDMMQTPFNEALRRGNVGKLNAVWTGFNSQRYYQKLLTADKRYNNTIQGDGTFGDKGAFYMDFNGIPLVSDQHAPERLAMLPAEVLKMYVLKELEFADETGSMYIAQTNADSLEVRLRFFTQLFNEQPAACAVLQGYISP